MYLVQDTWLDRLTVLKVLKSLLVDGADHRIRFQRETQAIVHLPHPHIVEILQLACKSWKMRHNCLQDNKAIKQRKGM